MAFPIKPPDCRILIASTPKTGNTWLKLLLTEIYDLPVVDLPGSFDEADFDFQHERWVGHQHYYPVPKLIAWARENQVCLLTTVRHPADVLVSLVHYVRNLVPPPPNLANAARLLAHDDEKFGSGAVRFVKREFFSWLDISVCWILARSSLIVRYEDLWADPVVTLSALTCQIHPTPVDRIKRAVARCDFDNLRVRSDPDGKFFRSGRIGEGYQVLPPAIFQILRSNEPYKSQFEILGYSLNPPRGSPDGKLSDRSTANPFAKKKEFDNGVPIPSFATELYTSVEKCFERWPHPLATEGTDTFLAWINGRAKQDPHSLSPRLITNLAAYIYGIRPDLQSAFPDPFRKDREAFADWFLSYGGKEYDLPDAFIEPVRKPRSVARKGRRKRRGA